MTSSTDNLCANCEDATKRLADANKTYHQMMTGKKAASITTSGESVLYGVATTEDRRDIKIYIAEIHQELAKCSTCINPTSRQRAQTRRAFKPSFGG